MSTIEYISAIDIGSNAIRMVLAERVLNSYDIVKKIRFPMRLGAEVFGSGAISSKKIIECVEIFKNFKEVNDNYAIKRSRTVATSAVRDAKNKREFISKIQEEAGIFVNVIDGIEEAKLIFEAVKSKVNLDRKHVVLIDIGGGSVEITVAHDNKMILTHSFPMGTVRILELLKKRKLSENHLKIVFNEFITSITSFFISQEQYKFDFAVGTGGNLETIAALKKNLLNINQPTFLMLEEVVDIYNILSKTKIEDRIKKFKLRPDRADVILPALLIVKTIMRQAQVNKLLIPKVGLREGVLQQLVRT